MTPKTTKTAKKACTHPNVVRVYRQLPRPGRGMTPCGWMCSKRGCNAFAAGNKKPTGA